MRISILLGIAALAAAAGFAAGQTRPSSGHSMMQLPVELPAVGNTDAVKRWRLGRVQAIERRGDSDDIVIHLRTADGRVQRIIGPREPLAILGRRCGWVDADLRVVAGRAGYVERMVAFDVDANGRLIAAISLEPFNRDNNRLRRALGRR